MNSRQTLRFLNIFRTSISLWDNKKAAFNSFKQLHLRKPGKIKESKILKLFIVLAEPGWKNHRKTSQQANQRQNPPLASEKKVSFFKLTLRTRVKNTVSAHENCEYSFYLLKTHWRKFLAAKKLRYDKSRNCSSVDPIVSNIQPRSVENFFFLKIKRNGRSQMLKTKSFWRVLVRRRVDSGLLTVGIAKRSLYKNLIDILEEPPNKKVVKRCVFTRILQKLYRLQEFCKIFAKTVFLGN